MSHEVEEEFSRGRKPPETQQHDRTAPEGRRSILMLSSSVFDVEFERRPFGAVRSDVLQIRGLSPTAKLLRRFAAENSEQRNIKTGASGLCLVAAFGAKLPEL